MKNALIFHGTGGYPEENWFPWMKKELELMDYEVAVPQFPTPEGQTLEAWFKVFQKYHDNMNEDTIIIGHSLGGIFLLRVLEKIQKKIALACFIGTPIGIKPIANYDSDLLFMGKPFDWDRIKNHAENFIVFHSDTDPYVSLENGKMLANNLGIALDFVPNAGHFNATAGYLKFDALLERIQKMASGKVEIKS